MRIRNFLLTCSVILAGLGLVDPVSAQTLGNVATVAGLGPSYPGHSGDGGLATAAKLQYPSGVAFDPTGNMYIADNNNYVIRKVSPSGIITTFAGTGSMGDSGDNGPATAATFKCPYKVAVDGSGNVYVADYQSRKIRKIDTSGTITTFAGTGTAGYSGDGGLAVNAALNQPIDIAVDSAGNVYIADELASCVRKVNTSGVISTVAGTGTGGYNGDNQLATSAQLNQPTGVGLDSAGNLYIAEYSGYRVRKVDTSGYITTFAGTGSYGYTGDGGPATSATIRGSFGIAADTQGDVYISDTNNQCIRKVDSSGIITTVAGIGLSSGYVNGPGTTAKFYNARGITIGPDGNLYIADQFNQAIRVLYLNVPNVTSLGTSPVAQATAPATVTFSGLSGTASSISMAYGTEFVVNASSCTSGTNPSCSVTFTPTYPGLRRDAILAKDSGGNVIGTQYVYGIGQGSLPVITPGIISSVSFGSVGTVHPIESAFDPAGNLYINDYPYGRIVKMTTGGVVSAITASGLGGAYLDNLACDGAGNLYSITSAGNLVKIASDGTTSVVTSGLSFSGLIGQLAISANGAFYVTDINAGRILKISQDGTSVSTLPVSTAMTAPTGLAFDTAGNLFISDPTGNQVVKVTAAGVSSSLNPGNVLQSPAGLATDAAGNLYVADAGNNKLYRIAPDTTTTVIAGTGLAGETGDGGPATSATIIGYGVAVAQDGTIYIGDRTNNVVRRISGSKLVFSKTNSGATSTQSALLTDIGNAAYTLPAAFTLAQNPSSYSVIPSGGTDCSTLLGSTLAAGTSCAVDVQFAPTLAGTITDTLSLGANLHISLSGVAIGPGTASPSTTSINFGNVTINTVSSAQTMTITNSGTSTLNVTSAVIGGTNAVDFRLLNDCGTTLAAGSQCSISVKFRPSVAAAESATLAITTADAVTLTPVISNVALSGTGVTATVPTTTPSLSVSSLNFGSALSGSFSSPQAITLTNVGVSALSLSGLTLSGVNAGDFAFSNACASTLVAGATCTVAASFRPASAGGKSAALNFMFANASMQSVTLTGTSLPAQLGDGTLSVSSLNFPNTVPGKMADAQMVTVTNTGGSTLGVMSVAVKGADASNFALTNFCGTSLAVNGNCTVQVDFSPLSPGSKTASLAFEFSNGGSAITSIVELSGVSSAATGPVPTGVVTITSVHSGRVLDVVGRSTLNGTPIQQYDYLGGTNQMWQAVPVDSTYYKIVSVATGKVLDGTAGFPSNGTPVQQWNYLGGDNQQWQFVPQEDGSFEIVNKVNGKALDVVSASMESQARLQLWAYNATDNQKWRLNTVAVPTPSVQYYTISTLDTGKVLDVVDASTKDTARIQQYDYLYRANQQWQLIPTDGGYYEIQNRQSGKVLDAVGYGETNGTQVQQYTYIGGDNQQWKLVPTANGYVQIVNKLSGESLDITGMSSQNGARLQTYAYWGGPNQQFELNPVLDQ